jgi:hypothetical protein
LIKVVMGVASDCGWGSVKTLLPAPLA